MSDGTRFFKLEDEKAPSSVELEATEKAKAACKRCALVPPEHDEDCPENVTGNEDPLTIRNVITSDK